MIWTLIFNLIRLIQLCDKKNLTFVEKSRNYIKLVLKNVIKLAKGSLNKNFQDSFNIILSQQLTRDRSYISYVQYFICLKMLTQNLFSQVCKSLGLFCQPCPKRQILGSSKLKEFADDNFEFDENGRKFSKMVENTVGKGEIACYEQFLLHSVFKRPVLKTRKNKGMFGKGLTLYHTITTFNSSA